MSATLLPSEGLRNLPPLGRGSEPGTLRPDSEHVPNPAHHQSHTSPLHGTHSRNGNRPLQPASPTVAWLTLGSLILFVAIYLFDGLKSGQPLSSSLTRADRLPHSKGDLVQG